MPELRVTSYERGFSDNYINGPRNAGQKFDNLLITRNRKPIQRPGSELEDSSLSQIPPGNQRIQHLHDHEDFLFEFSGDEKVVKLLACVSWAVNIIDAEASSV